MIETARPLFTPASRATRRGFTLTEVAIVIAIVGLILGAIWGAAADAIDNIRTARAVRETIAIVAAARVFWKDGPLVQWADVTQLAEIAGVFPSEMIPGGVPTGTANGPWPGSTVNLETFDNWAYSAGNASFNVAWWGLSNQACTRYMAAMLAAQNTGLVSAMINGQGWPYTLTWSVTDIGNMCNDVYQGAAMAPNSNFIQLAFTRY